MSKYRKKALSGVFWTSFRSLITAILGAALLIVKARYLTPEEFGVLAILNITIKIIGVVENFGLNTAIIQREVITKDEKSSLFFFQLLLCVFIGVSIVIISPVISNSFEMEQLTALLQVLSIIILINAPISFFSAFLEKNFYFKELSIINIIKEISLFILTSFLLILNWSLMGVVIGQVLAAVIMLTSVLILAYVKGLLSINVYFKLRVIKSYLDFGFFILGKKLIDQLTNNLDELIIGYFISVELLGYYHFAKNLLNQLRSLISTAFAKVMLPLLSVVKNDILKLTYTYNNISKYIGVFVFPIFFGLALTSNLFIPLLFGEKWLDSISFFFILAIAYIPYLLSASIAPNLLYVVNKVKVSFYFEIIINTIYILFLLLLSWIGSSIYIIVGLYAVYLIGKTTILQYIVQAQLESSFKDYMGMFKRIIIATILMGLFIVLTQFLMYDNLHLIYKLTITISSGAVVYFTSMYIIDRKTLIEIKKLVF